MKVCQNLSGALINERNSKEQSNGWCFDGEYGNKCSGDLQEHFVSITWTKSVAMKVNEANHIPLNFGPWFMRIFLDGEGPIMSTYIVNGFL